MKYEVCPQHDWCVFEEVKEEEQMQGRVILAQSASLPMKMGRIVSLGPYIDDETNAEPGDLVIYHEKVGVPFMVNGKKLLVTKGENFYCILKPIAEEVADEETS